MSDCLSSLALDRVVAGGVAPPHVATCPTCSERLASLRAAQEASRATVARLLQAAEARAAERRPARWPWLLAAAVVAASLVVLVPRGAPEEDEVRLKGSALGFFVQRGDDVKRGVSGDEFHAGDALRFSVRSGGQRFFFLVGVDANGAVAAYHPYGGERSVEVPVGREHLLPGSLVLDDAKGVEHLVGLFSDTPLSLAEVRAAITAARVDGATSGEPTLALPGSHRWVVLRKR